MAILEITQLRKSFGGLAAVDGFEFSLDAGELHALVGPNGCGKSTLFNLITGAFPATGGQVKFGGSDITGYPTHHIARLGVGRKFQVPAVFDELTVAENLAMPGWAGRRLGVWRAASAEEPEDLLLRIRLSEKRHHFAGTLSHGERQWLEIGMLLASRATLLLLDEPTAGMTMTETSATAQLIRDIAGGPDEVTVLVIEHDIGFIRELGCPVTVMAKGKVLRSGTYDEIRADAEVRELYFGRAN